MTTTLAPSPGTVVPNISPGAYSGDWTVILRPPQSLTILQSSNPPITGLPATAWATGTKVTLADASDAYWSGTTWVTGTAP